MKKFCLYLILLAMSCSIIFAGTAPVPPVKKTWVYAKDEGLVGDSVTDETTAFRAFLAKAKGKVAILDTNVTYLLTDSVALPEGTELDGRGSTLRFIGYNTRYLCLESHTTLKNTKVIASTDMTQQTLAMDGTYGAAILIGDYGTGEGYHDINIDNVTISASRIGVSALMITGNSYDMDIKNIHVPSNDSIWCAISGHWGNASASHWLSEGDTVTTHPHNINITNVVIDSLTLTPTAIGLSFRGCYAVNITNVEIKKVGKAIDIGAGDYGFFFADPTFYDTSIFAGQGMTIKNVISWSDSIGIYISGRAFPLGDTVDYSMPCRFENILSVGEPTTPGLGLYMDFVSGLEFYGCKIYKHSVGAEPLGAGVSNLSFRDCEFSDNLTYGMTINYNSIPYPDGILVEGCSFSRNASGIGMYVRYAKRVTIIGNTFGDLDETVQNYGLYLVSGTDSLQAVIAFNHVKAHNTTNGNFGGFRFTTKPVVFFGNTAQAPYKVYATASTVALDSIPTVFDGHLYRNTPVPDSAVMVKWYNDNYAAGKIIKNSPSNTYVLKYGTDSVYWAAEAGAGSGTADSLGVDTDGNGTVDNYLYSTVAGAFHLKEGANITFTVTGDTLAIAGPAASGTADSIGVDTDGNGTVDGWMYSTTAGSAHLKEGTGITLTLAGDTTTFATTLGTAVDTTERTASQWEEFVADYAGAMFTGNTETGIAVTYEDGDNTVDLVAEVTQAEFDAVCDDSTALKAAKDSVAAWDNGVLAKTADLGPFIDSTSLDTIQNAHKAVLADSTGGGAARSELADSCGGGAARAELADSCAGGAARSELADNVDDTANIVRAEIGDTINARMTKAVTGNTETGIAVTYESGDSTYDFVAEVTQAELDAVCDDTTKWNTAYAAYNTYEWHYLTMVHGFNRSLSDSIYLSFPWQTLNSDTLWLLCDSAGNITANDQDTVTISGSAPYACTIDSLEILYRITSGSVITSVDFRGPDRSTFTNLCDSLYWTDATDLDQAGATKKCYGFTNDVVATAGDRFALKYIVNFAADNNRLNIGWVRIRCKR